MTNTQEKVEFSTALKIKVNISLYRYIISEKISLKENIFKIIFI